MSANPSPSFLHTLKAAALLIAVVTGGPLCADPVANNDSYAAEEEGQVLHLYREALQFWENPDSPRLVEGFRKLERELERHPDEWLLRWNLLESLRKVDRGEELR